MALLLPLLFSMNCGVLDPAVIRECERLLAVFPSFVALQMVIKTICMHMYTSMTQQ